MHRILITLILALTTLVAGATSYTPETVPVQTQFRDSLDFNAVSNPDGIITQAQADSLNAMLWTLRQHYDVQGLVVCIKDAEFDDPYRFAIEVGRKHGVGGKNANGFVVFLATDSRGYYIITGEGFEKYLTDAQCSKIGRLKMVPYFKEGRWGEGIIAGVSTIYSICIGETELSSLSNLASNDDADGGDDAIFVIIFCIVLVFFFITVVYAARPKCPSCGKRHYRMTRRRVVKIAGSTKKVIVTDYYTCRDCGYKTQKQYNSTTYRFRTGEFDGSAPNGWGDIIATTTAAGTHYYGGGYGGGHSSFGGGGGFHSTFGGGSFGGGGAGGHF